VKDPQQTMEAIRFTGQGRVPMRFGINGACWQNYPQEALLDLMEAHTYLFPDFVRPKLPYVPVFSPSCRAGTPYTDGFGCVWETTEDGIQGVVTGHPLADWQAFDTYAVPDFDKDMGVGPVDWAKEAHGLALAREKGLPAAASLYHGHTFLRLADIRGYENLMYDMADEEPKLWELIERVEAFNMAVVKRYVAMDIDIMQYPEDLGMQNTPMLSPAHFRKYIKPSYRRIMQPARDAGVMIHMHSDGYIRDLADDLVDSGVHILNLQDLVNGIDWIAERYAGRHCIQLDIDRQSVTPMGTPAQIDAHIREAVVKLGTKRGGLMMVYGLYPGVPLANVKAVMDAMEKYAFYWEG